MSDKRQLYYHEVEYVRGLENRITTLQEQVRVGGDRIEALEFELKAAKNEVEIADSVIEQKRSRIEALEAALRRIDAINDSPARFSKDIDDVIATLAPESK